MSIQSTAATPSNLFLLQNHPTSLTNKDLTIFAEHFAREVNFSADVAAVASSNWYREQVGEDICTASQGADLREMTIAVCHSHRLENSVPEPVEHYEICGEVDEESDDESQHFAQFECSCGHVSGCYGKDAKILAREDFNRHLGAHAAAVPSPYPIVALNSCPDLPLPRTYRERAAAFWLAVQAWFWRLELKFWESRDRKRAAKPPRWEGPPAAREISLLAWIGSTSRKNPWPLITLFITTVLVLVSFAVGYALAALQAAITGGIR